MQVEFSAIHPDYILPLWNKIAPLFEKVIEYNRDRPGKDYYQVLVRTDFLSLAEV